MSQALAGSGDADGVTADAEAEALYRRTILERARAPHHASLLECFDAEAEGSNPMCGDRLTLRVRRDGAGRIEAVGYSARGCAISMASADLMADAVRGLGVDETRALSARFSEMVASGRADDAPGSAPLGALRALSGVHEFRSRIRCATLAWSALERALDRALGPEGE